ncbi:hypothetical protein EON65_34945 [archaeon]|nr:MAG: hypothetical protein EON65_34945 [archaeon]
MITDILEVIETCDPDDAQMQLVMVEFPMFLDYYRQLRDGDAQYASKCMAHWRLFLEGPPNKPNRDQYGLLRVRSGVGVYVWRMVYGVWYGMSYACVYVCCIVRVALFACFILHAFSVCLRRW